MSHIADQGLKDNYSGGKKGRGIFQRLMARPVRFIGPITIGSACLLLALFVFYPQRFATMPLLSDLKAGPKVFRTKIPEEILIAQNFFRGKFPVVDQPVKIPEKIETTPPLTIAGPTQSADLSSEKSELQQEFEIYPPAEPQSIILTILPEEEQSVSSPPIAAPSEQLELPVKADHRLVEIRPQPIKKEVTGKTEGRIIHREKWLLSQGSSYYTIQLMGVRKEALLFDFVERNQLLKQNEIAFYQSTFEDKVWFQLLYGVYVTKKDAQAAADNLPLKIRKSSPWIRKLSAVQKAIRAQTPQ